MKRPSLSELPCPSVQHTGWPWTTSCASLPATLPNGQPWPRISIVTPSFNQGQFIEETIRSILLQGYPNLEYIICDGGSSDQSPAIIEKYKAWLAHWEVKPDRGQVHAISKGLRLASGEIFQWINSDDVLLPGALERVGQSYAGKLVAGPILIGNSADNAVLIDGTRIDFSTLANSEVHFTQPGYWLPKASFDAWPLDERLSYAFDVDILLKYFMAFGDEVTRLEAPLAFFRLHEESKSVAAAIKFAPEEHALRARLSRTSHPANYTNKLKQALRRRIWRSHVHRIAAPGETKGWADAARLSLLMLRHPFSRIDRFSLGALKKMLLTAAATRMKSRYEERSES